MPEKHERLMDHNRREAYYHRFSEEEYARRREAVRSIMDEEGVDALVIYGNGGMFRHNQVNVHYLSNYRGVFLTYLVFFADEDEQPTLFTGISNHLQQVREVSVVDDIRLMLPDPPRRIVDRLQEANVENGTIGLVGLAPRYGYTIPHAHYETLDTEIDGDIVDVTPQYLQLHMTNSEEELEWIREAAKLTDQGMETLLDTAEPGVKEYELAAEVNYTYRMGGGEPSFSVLSSAPMEGAEPGECLPWKSDPATRTVQEGDVITTELTAQFGGYSAQLHRPLTVGHPPTGVYRDLYELSVEVYQQMLDALEPGATSSDIVEAVSPIEESEYKIYDVLLHGYGNGYLPPFIGTHQSNYWPGGDDEITENWVFEEGMVVVLQPNVVTMDERQGLQFGATVVIESGGATVLNEFPVAFPECEQE